MLPPDVNVLVYAHREDGHRSIPALRNGTLVTTDSDFARFRGSGGGIPSCPCDGPGTLLAVVLNWLDELKRLVPARK